MPPVALFFLAVDEDPAFELAFSVGGFSFTAFDDADYGFGYPVLAFNGGVLVGVDFLGYFPPPDDALAFDVAGVDVLITDDADGFRQIAAGSITAFSGPSVVSVAEPATFPLVLFAWPLIAAIRQRVPTRRSLAVLAALTVGLTALPGAPVYAQAVPIRLLTCPSGQVPVSVGTGWVCGNLPAGTAAGDRLVFVTSQLYTGDLDGFAGANEKCQARALAAGLPGTYRAWLSSNATAPDSVFAPGALTYRLVDGTPVASGWSDLTTEKYPSERFLNAPIDLDEFGVPVSGERRVWTGTTVKGTGGFPHCSLSGTPWATSDVAASGFYGQSDGDGTSWTEYSTTNCSTPLRLYCFQQ